MLLLIKNFYWYLYACLYFSSLKYHKDSFGLIIVLNGKVLLFEQTWLRETYAVDSENG